MPKREPVEVGSAPDGVPSERRVRGARRGYRRRLCCGVVAGLLACAAAAPWSVAQSAEPSEQRQVEPRTTAELEDAAIEAFAAGRYDEAERWLRRSLELDPDNFVPHYNLACVHAARGELEHAEASLDRAIELGFVDLRQLQNDPHLAPLRGRPRFERVVSAWSAVLDAHGETQRDGARELFGAGYTVSRDEALRLSYVSSYTETSTAEARAEIEGVLRWAHEHVFSGVHEAAAHADDPWAMVILPTQEHFAAWAVRTYGRSARQNLTAIGGHYSHDAKELWAADLGPTLRHEAFHIAHWRSSTRLGQWHAIWMQEGLASLLESIEPGEAGIASLAPCWRTNQARFMARAARLIPLENFCTMPRERFTAGRPLAHYAQARALFLWLHERGLLREFYRAYTEGYAADPSGYAALCAVAGQSGRELDRAFRAWAADLPSVPEEIREGSPSLGIDIEALSAGEGLRVTGFAPRRVAGGLRMGDVITHVNGLPVRDYYELVRRLSGCEVNAPVEVRFRRGREHGSTVVLLAPAR